MTHYFSPILENIYTNFVFLRSFVFELKARIYDLGLKTYRQMGEQMDGRTRPVIRPIGTAG